MSLARHLTQEFSATTRGRGATYFRQGRVSVLNLDEGRVEAAVTGSGMSRYSVVCDWSDAQRGVLATCTCPHYNDGAFCKHLWATFMAIEEDVPETIATRRRIDLVHGYGQEEDEDFLDENEEEDDAFDVAPRSRRAESFIAPLTNAIRSRSPNGARQNRDEVPSWHAELARLPMSAGDQAQKSNQFFSTKDRPRRVCFVLDISASFQADALVLNLFQEELRRDGHWGKAKPLKANRNRLHTFSPVDQHRLGLALGNYTGVPWSNDSRVPLHAQSFQQVSRIELVPAIHELLLPDLCADDCFGWVLGSDQSAEEARPLTWDNGEPWRFRLAVDNDTRTKSWTVRGELVRSEQILPLREPVLLLSSGIVVFQDRLARLAPLDDWRWLALLRAREKVTVPYVDRETLLRELWAAEACDHDCLPKNLRLAIERLAPRGALTIHPAIERSKLPAFIKEVNLYADVHFDYDGLRVALDDARRAVIDSAGDRVLIRNRAAEEGLIARLMELRVGASNPVYYLKTTGDVEFPPKRLGEIVEQLTSDGWQVQAEGRLIKQAGALRATIASGVDWLDLETEIDFDGIPASLPQLLAALQRNERFILLDDGSQGLLPQTWLDRYGPLIEIAQVDGDRLRFRPAQALLLDALLADREGELQIKVDRQFNRLRKKLRAFAGVKPRKAPLGFRGELRPYQTEGLGWLHFLEEFGLNGCLADDMGLGKTVQVLAQLVARRRRRKRDHVRRPSLVVAPKSVLFNWQLEAERFAPRLSVVNYSGTDRNSRADQLPHADLVITTYGTLRKDIESLKEVHFDYVVLDEAQAIKNDKSVSAKACRLLRSEHRLALTGTPVENHLGDLWSLFEFLNPGMLGRSSALRKLASSTGGADAYDANALEAIRRGVAPFLLRRTKQQVLKDLPKKNEQTLHVDLLPTDRKRYNELRDHYRASLLKRVNDSGMNAARMHVLEALLRLRQVACHAGLVDKKLASKSSAKLETLLEQIDEVVGEGHKALVFSQFTALLAIVKKALDKRGLTYEYLDGRTRNRQQCVKRFQTDPQCPLFLISLKAGGTGLNLTAADYVFLLDPWWNPAVEAQAIDRVHRIGQQRPVFAYRVVARDTVEEKILELQQKKRDLADAIISADKSLFRGLSLEDLNLLLS